MKNLTCSCSQHAKIKILIKTIRKKDILPDYYLKKLDSTFKSDINKIKNGPVVECADTDNLCEVFNTPNMGRGVRVKRDLVKNLRVGCYIGPIIQDKDYTNDENWKYQFQYIFKNSSIDGSTEESIMSLLNHSDKPNCDVEYEIHMINGIEEIHLTFILNKDVKKDDELYIDYGRQYWEHAAKLGIYKDIKQKLITDFFKKIDSNYNIILI